VAVRTPQLHRALRCFSLSAFSLLLADVEGGVEVEFAFEEHGAPGRPSLYEYRPLVRPYVQARAARLEALADTGLAVEELASEQAARIFSRAHAGAKGSEREALFRTVLLPLAERTAEACGGFDWSDECFERAYSELETSLYGGEHAYAAVAPLIGLTAGRRIELGRGVSVRAAAEGEFAAHWPEASGLLPAEFGREPDRLCLLELERSLQPGSAEPPDAPGELADAVTAIRLATAGPVAAGPVLFERLDWRPFGIRPVLPIAAAEPSGQPGRLDEFRGRLAEELLKRLALADDDPELAEALDRWELSLFQAEPFRSDQLREALDSLFGRTDGLWAAALRAAVLLGESGRERVELMTALQKLAAGEGAGECAADAVRSALVHAVRHGDRMALVASLDESLLGLRPRPAGSDALLAASAR
jgi:hypothetical protein